VTHWELVEKFIKDNQPADLPSISSLLRKAIGYGYALAALEVAEGDAKRNGAPEREGEGDAPRKQV
jgi:hypothetical protein